MELVYLGLGSNIGNREKNLWNAYDKIANIEGNCTYKFSKFYETAPVGGPPQPFYLNAALGIKTLIHPHSLLALLQHIETSMGRIRMKKWGPRSIDIDILLYGNKIINNHQLKIPHPLMHTRMFVLKPLAEIAPDVIHPVFNKTILQLSLELQSSLINKE